MIVLALSVLLLQDAPAKSEAPRPDPPSLDEALGIGGNGRDRSGAERDSKVERSLSGAPPRDILESAIADMRRSKELLEANEPGIPARRAQESAVRKLDELIASAERQQQQRRQQGQQGQQQEGKQQQQGGKDRRSQDGGSQGEGREGTQDEQGGSRESGGRREGQADDGRRSRDASGADATEPPQPVEPTETDAQFDESRAEWGRLPPRVREAVRQGFRDPMSAAYRRLTQEYYRRLAEDRPR